MIICHMHRSVLQLTRPLIIYTHTRCNEFIVFGHTVKTTNNAQIKSINKIHYDITASSIGYV